VEGDLPFDIVDMLDECSLEGWMLAGPGLRCMNKLTKNTDSQVLRHGSGLDSHIAGRIAKLDSICIGS
jgi:hypothetical protein